MRDLLKDLERWRAEGERAALATLVGVRGSAPRVIGARMAVSAGGRMAGSVSGGCVESDVMDRAIKALDSGRPELIAYDVVDDDEMVGVGLHCGSIDVLIQPYDPGAAWTELVAALEEEKTAVLVTALSCGAGEPVLARQTTVTETGAAGAIRADLDAAIREQAMRRLQAGRSERVTLDVGGGFDALFEVFRPRPRLFIVGATHTAVPLCRMAAAAGFRIAVVDPRKSFATHERFPDADEILREWPEQALGGDRLDGESFVVTVSHDAKFDIPALAAAMRAGAHYVGALGSRATHAGRREALAALGFTADDLDRIHAPVGLDIGAEGADEIAVAITAELLAVRRGRDAGAMPRARVRTAS